MCIESVFRLYFLFVFLEVVIQIVYCCFWIQQLLLGIVCLFLQFLSLKVTVFVMHLYKYSYMASHMTLNAHIHRIRFFNLTQFVQFIITVLASSMFLSLRLVIVYILKAGHFGFYLDIIVKYKHVVICFVGCLDRVRHIYMQVCALNCILLF